MEADAAAPADLASRHAMAVEADADAPAVLTFRLFTAVHADAAAPAVLALRLLTTVDASATGPRSPYTSIFPAAQAAACSTTNAALRLFLFLRAEYFFPVQPGFLAFCPPEVVRIRGFLVRAD